MGGAQDRREYIIISKPSTELSKTAAAKSSEKRNTSGEGGGGAVYHTDGICQGY